MEIYMFTLLGIMGCTLIFTLYAKKKRDANEPLFKKVPKDESSPQSTANKNKSAAKSKGSMTIKELLGIEHIEKGIFHKQNNEYAVVIEASFVNYDLLSDGSKQGILLGYQSFWRVVKFPVQILGQSVSQDMRKEEIRFKKNLKETNAEIQKYNDSIISTIKKRSEHEFRVTKKVYYLVAFNPLMSKISGSLSPEKKKELIEMNLQQRAWTVISMLRQSHVEAGILDSLRAMEVVKRSLNRDRMLYNPIEDVVLQEKLATHITWDFTTVPGFEDIVQDVEEVRDVVQEIISNQEEKENVR